MFVLLKVGQEEGRAGNSVDVELPLERMKPSGQAGTENIQGRAQSRDPADPGCQDACGREGTARPFLSNSQICQQLQSH